jgi:L-amino acid N-acyltransferase YncA
MKMGRTMTENTHLDNITLEKYDFTRPESLAWYQDSNIQLLVNDSTSPFTPNQVDKMYAYQNSHGNLYYIVSEGNTIGDVWVSDDDFAIVISPEYQHHGIGGQALDSIIEMRRKESQATINVKHVAFENTSSIKLFQSRGFNQINKPDNKGFAFTKQLH